MQNIKKELAPCPFCGGEACAEERDQYDTAIVLLGCTSCEIWCESECQWNTRAPQSEWISVDGILPDRLVNVLVKQIYQGEIMLAYISACGEFWIECCENAYVNGDAWLSKEICKVTDAEDYLKITHWMPLPTPPKDLK